ncbi:MAG: LytTR family DNA-binding domain-containing protein [Burkholderiales bacterium]
MEKITALIADDEPLMREQLRMKLAHAWPELDIVAEAKNGDEALQFLAEKKPQIVFLDIRMPGMSGLQTAQHMAGEAHIVFVTAYDQYAVEAFEHGAVDYLLKPVEAERLQTTVARLKQRLASPPQDLTSLLSKLTATLNPSQKKETLRWIKASVGDNLRFIPVDEVLYFQSDDKYTNVYTDKHEAVIKTPIKELLDSLDAEKFWQIHRATIINMNYIDSVSRDFRGQASIKLKGRNEKLQVSRTFSHLFKQM